MVPEAADGALVHMAILPAALLDHSTMIPVLLSSLFSGRATAVNISLH